MTKVIHSLYVVKHCLPDGWEPVAAFIDFVEAVSYVDKKVEDGADIGEYVPFESEISIPLYI